MKCNPQNMHDTFFRDIYSRFCLTFFAAPPGGGLRSLFPSYERPITATVTFRPGSPGLSAWDCRGVGGSTASGLVPEVSHHTRWSATSFIQVEGVSRAVLSVK